MKYLSHLLPENWVEKRQDATKRRKENWEKVKAGRRREERSSREKESRVEWVAAGLKYVQTCGSLLWAVINYTGRKRAAGGREQERRDGGEARVVGRSAIISIADIAILACTSPRRGLAMSRVSVIFHGHRVYLSRKYSPDWSSREKTSETILM